MMKVLFAVFASVFLTLTLPNDVQAHSLGWVEKNLGKKGNFLQPVHKPAPMYELIDNQGEKVTQKSFPGKIIILFFLDGSCVDACLKQVRRMARFQAMLNITPMRETVQFVAVSIGERKSVDNVDVDPVNWIYLSGKKAAVSQLRKDFGQGDQSPAKPIAHVVGSKGQWRSDFRGVKYKLVNFLIYLNALQNSIYGITDGHGK